MRDDNGMKRSASMPKLLMKKKYNIHSIPGIIVLKGEDKIRALAVVQYMRISLPDHILSLFWLSVSLSRAQSLSHFPAIIITHFQALMCKLFINKKASE
uniref:GST N-terminal domain-containing protein n=1 Tax=Caenorhabditis tropicalis TaxID=1561998 RepID=A0A1I7U179_9PELO